MVFSSPFRLWLLPSGVVLAAMGLWGGVRYAHLPDRIPKHIGVDGVDAWADRSIGSAFMLVFVYVGVTLLMVGSVELALRTTPRDEMPDNPAPFASGASSYLINRPASRAAARRLARALLAFNALIGASFLVSCGVLWRSTSDPHVPAWLFTAIMAPIVAGTVLTVVAALSGRKR